MISFEEKNKEPELSTELANIISRSTIGGEKSNYDDIARYKYNIMKLLLENHDLLRTLHLDIDSKDKLNSEMYKDVCIFSYLKLPNNQSKVKNYVLFEVEDTCYGDLLNKRIIFRTVCHENDEHTDWGIARHDLLAVIIKNQFDWSNCFGMHVEKETDVGKVTNDGYYYREIVYKTTTPNNVIGKINSSRRR